jgi:signal transduction histidine kinase/ActR/RegA family two-component response regulator
MRTQLLTVLVSFSWSSAGLLAMLTRWIATTRRWRDQQNVAFHMLTGAAYSLSLTAPTVLGLSTTVLQGFSALALFSATFHYHAWRRILAQLEGRPLRRWEYGLAGVSVAVAGLAFVPGLMFDGALLRLGYEPWGLACLDVAPNAVGSSLITALIASHLPTIYGIARAHQRGARGARVFLVAAVGEMVCALVDMASLTGLIPLPYVTPFWSMMYIAVMASSIARRFVEDAAELDALSNTLEDRVAARTQELAEARRVAEDALQARGNFLAMMSHEIRTPLNGVLGMTGVLLESPLQPEQRSQLETIHRCGFSLLTLLNDILDFAKIEAGRMLFEEVPFAPRALVAECLDVLAQAAAEGHTRLESSIDATVPMRVVGDPSRVRQVLLNLAGNAVKFTRGGTVTVIIEREGTDRLRVAVRDTGLGIAAEALGRLFQPFVQADASTTRRFGGTGLGLAICRRLVDAMGGVIGAESELGRGSTFWFTVPLVAAPDLAPTLPTTAVAARRRALRVLVAEDNAVNQRVVSAILARQGHLVRVVGDGREALDALEVSPYDVVLMDCEMPELDGYAATRLLREREGESKHTRVVALTANAFEEDRQRALASGMDAWLTKPFRHEDLLRALASLPPAAIRSLPPTRPSAG